MRLFMRAMSPRRCLNQRSRSIGALTFATSCSISQALADDLGDELFGAVLIVPAQLSAGVVAIVELREIAMQMLL